MISQREEFRFRLEKVSEIVKCLNELGINVTEADILAPEKNREHHQLIFEQLTELCTGITREEMSQPIFKGLSALNYPDLHDESTTNLNTFRACSKMMEACGIHSFTIKDLMVPNAKRSRKFLSGIINFLKFREERLGLLSELNSSRDALLERLNNTKEKGDIVGNRLNKLKEQTEEDAQLIAHIENDIRDIESQIGALTQQQNDARDDSLAYKARSAQIKEELARKAVILEEAQQTKKSLSKQVVTSPERFRKRILDASASLQNEQKEGKNSERRFRELNAWLTNVGESQVEVDLALESIVDFRTDKDRQKAVVTEFDAVCMNDQAKNEAVNEIEQTTQQISRSVNRAEEKLQHLRKQSVTRTTEGKHAAEELHGRLVHTDGLRTQLRVLAERREMECERVVRESEMEKSAMDQELEDMVSAYKRLERLVTDHLRTLTHALQIDTSINCV